MLNSNRILVTLVICFTLLYVSSFWNFEFLFRPPKSTLKYDTPEDFAGFDNETGARDGCYIVPNYVHFVRLGQPVFTFVDAVCILAAYKNQKPDVVFIHTDVPNFTGKYWEVLLNTEGFRDVLKVTYVDPPTQIFGQSLSKHWQKFHAGDLVRLQVLMKFGGIFLDNDAYVVRSLNDFRRYEMSLGWRTGGNISNQVIIAHKNARFLNLWLETYRNYNPKCWFCNAGIIPTREVLTKMPYLVHRVPHLLVEYGSIIKRVFMNNWDGWRSHYAVHLLIRHQYMLKNVSEKATYPVKFNEENIKYYPVSFRDMVYDVYPILNESQHI